MVIEINTDTLVEAKVTANQFLLAQLIYEDSWNIIKSIKELYDTQEDFDTLTSAGYLKSSRNAYIVTPKFVALVKGQGMFEQLLALFPTSVLRPDGTKDYLRVGHERCKIRYNNIIKKSKARHDHIVKCLELEVNIRTQENKLGYMKRLANWLTAKEWEAWSPRLEEASSPKTISYGEDLE